MLSSQNFYRSVVKVSPGKGENSSVVSGFLQGLITQDIKRVNEQSCYSLMLNSSGRYEFDFFITKIDNSYYLDAPKHLTQKLLQKLAFYKLITKVEITEEHDLSVVLGEHSYNSLCSYNDPRHTSLPIRSIVVAKEAGSNLSSDDYNSLRYSLNILEGDDFIEGKSIPIEYGMDELGAISYNKGCYVGQEFTNSAKNKLEIRYRILCKEYSKPGMQGSHITNSKNEKVGEVLQQKNGYLLIRLSMRHLSEQLFLNNEEINLEKASWIKTYSIA